jgi:hypothetical protein
MIFRRRARTAGFLFKNNHEANNKSVGRYPIACSEADIR